jgi:hypothetical protein
MKTSIPTTVKTLQTLGFLAVIVAAGCLFGTFLTQSDIYMAFLLGAFLVSLISIILLFGFSKVIQVLGEIRDKAPDE